MTTFHLMQRELIPMLLYYIISYLPIMDIINVWLLMNMAEVILIMPHLLLQVLPFENAILCVSFLL